MKDETCLRCVTDVLRMGACEGRREEVGYRDAHNLENTKRKAKVMYIHR